MKVFKTRRGEWRPADFSISQEILPNQNLKNDTCQNNHLCLFNLNLSGYLNMEKRWVARGFTTIWNNDAIPTAIGDILVCAINTALFIIEHGQLQEK